MNKYIVTWRLNVGEIWRADPDWQVVAFLHCGEAEARQIADDLGGKFVSSTTMYHTLQESAPQLEYRAACPNNCEHARQYAFPDLTWAA